MKLYIYSLQKTLFEGEAVKVTLPATDGEITILPHHIPLVTTLGKGSARVELASGEKREFPVIKGVLQVNKQKIILLLD